MPPEELEVEAAKVCEHCKAGRAPRWRSDTKEWTHDFTTRASFSHTICGANDLRKANANG